ncbi:Tat-linked quality control protein TatD [mine drainage metagenome]|uniref:Tat-linked quality control protein TatD n=1 Tax=mine drainage metagenome TaxID=410659 RepID=A0A1J5QA84_9ZZZZ
MTFDRALNILRLAAQVPDTVPVLETDAPDIPPVWLYQPRSVRPDVPKTPNSPAELPRIAQTLAELRGWTLEQTAEQTTANALRALPRLEQALDCKAPPISG